MKMHLAKTAHTHRKASTSTETMGISGALAIARLDRVVIAILVHMPSLSLRQKP
jgi:hypothetical protein